MDSRAICDEICAGVSPTWAALAGWLAVAALCTLALGLARERLGSAHMALAFAGMFVRAWIGYSALWVDGIATAPGQIPGNDLLGNAGVANLGPPGASGVDVSDILRIDGANAGTPGG